MKACRESNKQELEQQYTDTVLALAYSSVVPILVDSSQPDPIVVFESAPIYKGADAD